MVADPGAAHLLGLSAYTRGFMTLQALRNRIGDSELRQVIRAWVASNRYGNGSTEDFVALANRVSGRDLNDFFHAWLYAPTMPSPTQYNGCSASAGHF
ncbi:M1 family metallopeptidase [Fodinicola feengrottensis]|uniref:Peptidase M1 membrane alanine aminopeptidase domain-containing protein n=1 Tax=Fodinicola feengrottensis TaxID=435914 RepID=A0ABN2HRN9_9ACTN|nr:M1 family metallopeptidase [Fodinicola feengrottensis]